MIDLRGTVPVSTNPTPESDHRPRQFLGSELSEEDYREACANLAAFFLTLKRWRDSHGKA